MSEQINLTRQVYEKQQYRKVINTAFTELTPANSTNTPEAQSIPTLEQFFLDYQRLFYTIPKTGDYNSHEYIVKQSGEYLGGTGVDPEIQALLQEVTFLREENLKLSEQLANIKTTNG